MVASNVVDAKAGMLHTVFLLPDGRVAAIGDNSFGQCEVDDWDGVRLPDNT